MASKDEWDDQEIRILYTNWRGETAWRRIRPIRMEFAETQWHPDPQWLMHALDLEKRSERSFAMRDVSEWQYSSVDRVKSEYEKCRFAFCGKISLTPEWAIRDWQCPGCGEMLMSP